MPRGTRKPATSHVDPKLATLVDKVNKEFGPGTILLGSEVYYDHIPRIGTGSLSFDVMLGGGWTVNSSHEIIGWESSGKTTLILKTIAHNQALNPNFFVFWVAAEEFVPSWAAQLGCDLQRIMVLHTNEMQAAYNAVLEVVDAKSVDMVVIDSTAALVPAEEDDGNMLEWQMGLAARVNGKFFRKVAPAMRRSMVTEERPCTLFFVNQWREKIGVMYGDPKDTPGGKAKNFAFFTRVELTRDEWIEEGTGRDKRKVGISIKARTRKNKTAPPERTAVVDFYWDYNDQKIEPGSYDPVKEIFALGLYYGIIRRAGAFYRYGEEQWQGQAALGDELRWNMTLQSQIRSEVLTCVLKGRKAEEPEPEVTAPVQEGPKRVVRRRKG